MSLAQKAEIPVLESRGLSQEDLSSAQFASHSKDDSKWIKVAK